VAGPIHDALGHHSEELNRTPRTVVWFRRDLRLVDNTALAAALARGGHIVPLFVLDPVLMGGRDRRREAWVLATLRALDAALRAAGAGLVVRRGDPRREVPRVAQEAGAQAVYWNQDYTPYARRRDAAIARALEEAGREVAFFHDGGLVEPGALRTVAGRPYTVFTPYYRAWSIIGRREPGPAPTRLTTGSLPGSVPVPGPGDFVPLPHAGASAAQATLARFVATRLPDYKDRRDRLDDDATSHLSIHLRVGAISPRQIVNAVERTASVPHARGHGIREAASAFVRELAWRDFFVQVLWHEPDSRTRELRADRRGIPWRDDARGLAAWCEGRTGYPIVDAGMRQLAATGWMPNRARLVAASFLTKHLLVDWRLGERWFMRQLLDGDPAVNGGNWQWVASTGTDAMPAFRIFNPVAQGRRFDPTGAYVRRWVPELAGVAAAHVHEPWLAGGATGYPPPIVDHAEARQRALRVLHGRPGSLG
jgi:deoxyribodipyrimidine photo-lyase